MSSESASSPARPAELVAGFLAVVSIVASVIALFWYPLRLSPFAVLLALIATGMSPRNARLPMIAVGVAVLGFILGATIAVTTDNPLY
jgi:hypothetical protein